MLAASFQLPDYVPIVSHFATHAMWLVCFDILKIVNWKSTVSVEIHNNSSLSSGSRYCKPEVISWWKVDIRVVCFTRVFCPRLIRNVWSRRRFDSSSIISQPVNFDIQRERVLKCDAKNSTYINTYRYIDITLSISNMDFQYQFNLRLHHFWGFFPC